MSYYYLTDAIAISGAACTAGASMATAAGMPALMPGVVAMCGIAADTVSRVTPGAMEDTLS